MTSETLGQLLTAVLVILGWYLNHRQSRLNSAKLDEVQRVVDGPLARALISNAALTEEKALATRDPVDQAAATAAATLSKDHAKTPNP